MLNSVVSEEILVPKLEVAMAEWNWPESFPIEVYPGDPEPDDYYHPSTDPQLEPLQLYYKFHPGYERLSQRFDTETMVAMLLGSASHSIIQALLIHLGLVRREDVEVEFVHKESNFCGHIDWIYQGIPFDFKTCARLPDKVAWYYVLQALPYMDFGPGGPYDEFRFLFMEKSPPHRLKELTIRRQDHLEDFEKMYQKFQQVEEAIEASDPSGLKYCCNGKGKAYDGCPYRNVCRVNDR